MTNVYQGQYEEVMSDVREKLGPILTKMHNDPKCEFSVHEDKWLKDLYYDIIVDNNFKSVAGGNMGMFGDD